MSGSVLGGAALMVELSLDAFARLLATKLQSELFARLDEANAMVAPEAAIHVGLDLAGGRPEVRVGTALLPENAADPSSRPSRHLSIEIHVPHVESWMGRGPRTAWTDVWFRMQLRPFIRREAASPGAPLSPVIAFELRELKATDSAGVELPERDGAFTPLDLVRTALRQMRFPAPSVAEIGDFAPWGARVLQDPGDPRLASIAIVYAARDRSPDEAVLRPQLRGAPGGVEDYAVTIGNDTLLAAIGQRVVQSRRLSGLEAYHIDAPLRLRSPVWVRLGSGSGTAAGELTRLTGVVDGDRVVLQVSFHLRRVWASASATRTVAHELSDAGVFEQLLDVHVELTLRAALVLDAGGTRIKPVIEPDIRVGVHYTPLFWVWLALSVVVLAPLSGVALAVTGAITALVLSTVAPLLLEIFSGARVFDALATNEVNLDELRGIEVDLREVARALEPNRLERITLDDLTLATDRIGRREDGVRRAGFDRLLRQRQGLDLDDGTIVTELPRLTGPAAIALQPTGLWTVDPERIVVPEAPVAPSPRHDAENFVEGSFRTVVRTAAGRLAQIAVWRRAGVADEIYVSYRTLERRVDELVLTVSAEPLRPPAPEVGPGIASAPTGTRYVVRTGVRAGVDAELALAQLTWSIQGHRLQGDRGALVTDDGTGIAWSILGTTLWIDAPLRWSGAEVQLAITAPGLPIWVLREQIAATGPLRPEFHVPPGVITSHPVPGAPTGSPRRSQSGPAASSAFLHEADVGTISANSTFLTHPALDGRPEAVLLVTPHASADAAHYGVWYDGHRWAIFRQDRQPLSPRAFSVAIVDGVVHTASPEDTEHNYTTLDHPLANGNPRALVFVTQRWRSSGENGGYNDRAIGVFYDVGRGRWAIYNEDRSALGVGLQFNVQVVSSPDGTAEPPSFLWHVDAAAPGGAHVMPAHAGGPGDVLILAHNWSPGTGRNVYYDDRWTIGLAGARWQVTGSSGAAAPHDAAFNVLRFRA